MRPAGRSAAVLGALLLAACSPPGSLHSGPDHPVPADGSIRIDAAPLPLNPRDPAQVRLGDFVFAGAVALTSPDTSLLGGLSDLKVSDAGELTAESDEGTLLRARIVLGPGGRLAGLDNARITPLKDLDGRAVARKKEADAEGVAVWPDGRVMVSFERDHRIWLYPAGNGPPRVAPKPDVVLPENDGMEALAVAPKEGADAYWVGVEAGRFWLCRLGGACAAPAGQFPPPRGYRLTSLFELPDGRMALLHHHWDPFGGSHAIVSVIDNPSTTQAPALRARFRLDPPLTVDNFEGLAMAAGPDGSERFYLITDNNFSARQRTILMAFDWKPAEGRP